MISAGILISDKHPPSSTLSHLARLCAGLVHPTLNVEDPDEGVDTSVIVGAEQQRLDVNVALSNSFGFGGHNSCVLFRSFSE